MTTYEDLKRRMILFAEAWQKAETQESREWLLQHYEEDFLCIAMVYLTQ